MKLTSPTTCGTGRSCQVSTATGYMSAQQLAACQHSMQLADHMSTLSWYMHCISSSPVLFELTSQQSLLSELHASAEGGLGQCCMGSMPPREPAL